MLTPSPTLVAQLTGGNLNLTAAVPTIPRYDSGHRVHSEKERIDDNSERFSSCRVSDWTLTSGCVWLSNALYDVNASVSRRSVGLHVDRFIYLDRVCRVGSLHLSSWWISLVCRHQE